MAHGGSKPVDLLLSELDFLADYLRELAELFRSEGKTEEAERADSWALLPEEAADKISDLLN
jgi:hypothetical protein